MKELEKKMIELEKNLIEQEHRPLHIITNYLKREQYAKKDPRRLATSKAFVWRLLFSPTTMAAATGGTIAIVSIFYLAWQTHLLRDQNQLIKNQNRFFKTQILGDDIRSNRDIMYNSNSIYSKPQVFNAILEYQKNRTLLDSTKRVEIIGIDLKRLTISGDYNAENIDFINVDFRGAQMNNINFKGSTFKNCKFGMDVNIDQKLYNSIVLKEEFGQEEAYPTVFNNCNFSKTIFKSKNEYGGTLFFECDFKNSNVAERIKSNTGLDYKESIYDKFNGIINCNNIEFQEDQCCINEPNKSLIEIGQKTTAIEQKIDSIDSFFNKVKQIKPKFYKSETSIYRDKINNDFANGIDFMNIRSLTFWEDHVFDSYFNQAARSFNETKNFSFYNFGTLLHTKDYYRMQLWYLNTLIANIPRDLQYEYFNKPHNEKYRNEN